MKNVIVVLFIILSISCFGEQQKIYKSATEFDYPPFSVITDGKADGFSVEILKAAADEAGIKIEFKIDEWNTIKNELKEGKLDVLPLVGRTEEREAYYDFTAPYIIMYGNIFVRKDNKTINSEDDLFGKEIIVMEGDNAQEYALRRKFTGKLILTKTYSEALKLLDSGKGDAVLAQNIVGIKLINDLKLKNIKAVTKVDKNGIDEISVRLSGFEQKFCFAVKEGDKELLEKLNEALAIISSNGKYQEIYDKWFPFLINNKSYTKKIGIYLISVLIPLGLLITIVFFVILRREIKIKTKQLLMTIEEAKENEEKYKLLAENTVECIWLLNIQTNKYKYISPAITKLRGMTVEEAMNEKPEESMTVESAEKMKRLASFRLPRFLNGENIENIDEFKQKCKDGTIKDIEMSTKFILDKQTNEVLVLGVSRDITEKNKIKRTNTYHRNLLEASIDPLVTIDMEGKISDVNSATEEMSGYKKEELIGTDFSDYFIEHEKAREGYKKVFLDGSVRDYILQMKHRDGEVTIVAYNASVYKDENENIIGVFAAARDITEQKNAEKVLEEYRDRLEVIVKTRTKELENEIKERIENERKFKQLVWDMQVGVLLHGPKTEMILCNPKALELLGLSQNQLLGKTSFDPDWNVIHEDGSPFPAETHPVSQAIATRNSVHNVIMGVYRPSKNDRIWLSVDAIPQFNSDTTISQVIITFIDITELKKTEIELVAAKEKAEKASKSKSEFLSNMSHELRTPLNAILGFTSVLYEGEIESEKKEILSIVEESGRTLLALIEDILDMSKIEAEMMTIRKEAFEIEELADDIEKMFKNMVTKKGNELRVINKCKTRKVIGDEYRVKQIIVNLIGNANKFTENGKLLFEITETKSEKMCTEINFKVIDTGVGISSDKMDHLFEMFNQGEHFLTKKYGGTGLGLAIVKKLTELMGGEINVESKINFGTSFEIKIPFQMVETEEVNKGEFDVKEEYIFRKSNILIVEDSEFNIKYLDTLLKYTDIEYKIAYNGEEAVSMAAENNYELILMDIQLPVLNGVEAIKRIREQELKSAENKRVPIIAVSAYAMQENIEKALAAGADEYLIKPFSKIDLFDIIKKWLSLK